MLTRLCFRLRYARPPIERQMPGLSVAFAKWNLERDCTKASDEHIFSERSQSGHCIVRSSLRHIMKITCEHHSFQSLCRPRSVPQSVSGRWNPEQFLLRTSGPPTPSTEPGSAPARPCDCPIAPPPARLTAHPPGCQSSFRRHVCPLLCTHISRPHPPGPGRCVGGPSAALHLRSIWLASPAAHAAVPRRPHAPPRVM